MGTDISFFVERRKKGRWVSCDKWELIKDGDFRDLYCVVKSGTNFYNERNYDLFAILADVRNGYGFAGLDTGDGFKFIAEPRGLPNDMSSDLAENAEWEVEVFGGRTPSWLTVAEIMAFDWTQTTVKRGFVKGAEFEEWIRSRRDCGLSPSGYCALPGPTQTIVTEPEMLEAVNGIKGDDPPKVWRPKIKKDLENTYCHVSWEETYRNAAGSFITETLPRMQRLGDPGDVRCVFWFD